ncbi:MAG: hypothetical protein RLZZ584_2002 [Pseudomonadota bacterium]|jgi:putative nucleotidyltransferase with HDIG domain
MPGPVRVESAAMPTPARSTPAQPAPAPGVDTDPSAGAVRTRLVDVAALQPGLHVELDLGWLDHPFPGNRLRLRDQAQIATLARLGLSQVRVRLDLSEPAAVAALTLTQARDTAAATAPAPPAASCDPAPDETIRRRASLARQRRSLARSERQHGQAVRAWQALARAAQDDPVATGQAATSYAARLVDELDSDADTCLRVLHHGGGPAAALHGVNVTVLALLLARRLGLPTEDQQAVALGALLHDIGKLLLPEPLRQGGPGHAALELRARRDHVLHGVRLGLAMGLPPAALRVIAQHHELHDGSGLPQGLRGEDISRPARIVALVDSYERLCNPAGPGVIRTPHEAQALLYAQLRAQLDPVILAAFVKLLGVYPPGSVVQLSDDRHAMVVAAHPDQPLAPSVLVHDAGVPRDEAVLVHLHTTPGLAIRRSLPPRQLPRATLDYLAPTERPSWYHAQALHDDDQACTLPGELDALASRVAQPTPTRA